MTFRVSDLMIQPYKAAANKPQKPGTGRGPCGECTNATQCGICSLCTDCTVCTQCSVCTCTRCTLTALSTCTGETAAACTCPVTSTRNLILLQAALHSKVQSLQA